MCSRQEAQAHRADSFRERLHWPYSHQSDNVLGVCAARALLGCASQGGGTRHCQQQQQGIHLAHSYNLSSLSFAALSVILPASLLRAATLCVCGAASVPSVL
jgi:hypothetical protein